MKTILWLVVALCTPLAVAAEPPGAVSGEIESAPAQVQAPQPVQAQGEVLRAAFTSGVRGREPVDNILSLGNNESRIYYYTDLRGLQGQTVTHRWQYDGRVVAEVEFQVAGPRWRVWSSKNLLPNQVGEWRVTVLNGAGEVLYESKFAYIEHEAEGAPASPPPPTGPTPAP